MDLPTGDRSDNLRRATVLQNGAGFQLSLLLLAIQLMHRHSAIFSKAASISV
jgi:hypothetical protein